MQINLTIDSNSPGDLKAAKLMIDGMLTPNDVVAAGKETPFLDSASPHTQVKDPDSGSDTPPVPAELSIPVTEPDPPSAPLHADTDYPERDKKGDGVRWDERIHSGSHKLTTRDVWARRKNIDEDVFAAVMLELQAEVTTAAQTFNPAPASIPTPPGEAAVDNGAPAVPVTTGVDWQMTFQRILQAISAGSITQEQVDRAVVTKMGEGKNFSNLVEGGSAVWEMVMMELGV